MLVLPLFLLFAPTAGDVAALIFANATSSATTNATIITHVTGNGIGDDRFYLIVTVALGRLPISSPIEKVQRYAEAVREGSLGADAAFKATRPSVLQPSFVGQLLAPHLDVSLY